MSKKAKNGANKKLHTKLIKQKKVREQSAKEKRKAIMREMNKKAVEVNESEDSNKS